MPIVRWHGWAAKCRKCGQPVPLCDDIVAYEEREHARDIVTNDGEFKVEEGITDICGCVRRASKGGEGESWTL